MKKKLKFFGCSILVVFVLFQFYPTDKPKLIAKNPNDIILTNKVPKNIAVLLKAACYDCHSNESVLPWYSNITPVKWLIYDHIKHGRGELNFSEWNTLTTDEKSDALDDISSVVLEGEMPLENYAKLHTEAKLSEADREAITAWADEMLDSLYE